VWEELAPSEVVEPDTALGDVDLPPDPSVSSIGETILSDEGELSTDLVEDVAEVDEDGDSIMAEPPDDVLDDLSTEEAGKPVDPSADDEEMSNNRSRPWWLDRRENEDS
jgi:hypothetical protein